MYKTFRARRGGFTLVELLIVIIIIAILAGMMMMTTGSATDRAEATKVISDLRALKSAALMYYVDNMDWPWASNETQARRLEKSLSKYLDRSLDNRYSDGIYCRGVANVHVVIGFRIANHTVGVRNILADSAREVGLFMTMGLPENVAYFSRDLKNHHIYMRLK